MKNIDKNKQPFSDNGKQQDVPLLWDDARVFLAIARSGTLSATAKQLGIGLATVSRRIERLEESLGVPLFSRHQDGYRLTDDGSSLLLKAEVLEQAGHAFFFAAEELTQAAGTVRLATTDSVMTSLIMPSLPVLLEKHPGLNIDVLTDIKTVNLHRREADLAIRMVKPESGNITFRQLAVIEYGLYGSSGYIQNRHPDQSYENDQYIGWTESLQHLPVSQYIKRLSRGRRCKIMVSSIATQIAAAQADLGLTVIPHFLAKPAGLICLENLRDIRQPVWLAIHSDLIHSQRVRIVADHLVDLFEKHYQAISGEV